MSKRVTISTPSCILLPDMLYLRHKKSNRPQGGLTSNYMVYRITTPSLAKVPGWFFYALKHYLINVNTNVSNARMNIPNAIRSLKSKWLLSISTTPILCRIEASHPVTRLLYSQYNILPFSKQSDFHSGSSPATASLIPGGTPFYPGISSIFPRTSAKLSIHFSPAM